MLNRRYSCWRCSLQLLLICLLLGGSASAYAIDTYDPATNVLTIPLVVVGPTTYTNVKITVGIVIGVGSGAAANTYDTYSSATNQLTIPAVLVGTTTYTNVVITVGSVISVGGSVPTPMTPPSTSPTEGPGDVGNFFPFTQGNTWAFQGTSSTSGGPTANFVNAIVITNPTEIRGVTVTAFTEINPENTGQARRTFFTKDSRGIINQGNDDPTDLLTPQLVPFQEVLFPLQVNSSFEQVHKTGLNFGNATADVISQVTVAAFEVVNVPAGTFPNSAEIATQATVTVTRSSDGVKVTATGVQTWWFASGVGLVKRTSVMTTDGVTETVTEELIGHVAGDSPLTNEGSRSILAPTPFTVIVSLNKPIIGQVATRGESFYSVSGLIPGTTHTVSITRLPVLGLLPGTNLSNSVIGAADLHVFPDATFSFEADCTLRVASPQTCTLITGSSLYFSVRAGPIERVGARYIIQVE